MSKRFTETTKWAKPWFRMLDIKHKLLWQWLCDNCDTAGVLEPDWGLASFQIGAKITASDLGVFESRVMELDGGKVWLTGFVDFQCGKLSRDCKPHMAVFASMEKHGIYVKEDGTKGYTKGIHTLVYKDQDKEKDKEKEKDPAPESGEPSLFDSPPQSKASKAKPSDIGEVMEYAEQEGITESEAEDFWDKMEAGGWKRGKAPIADWKAHLRTYHRSGWLSGASAKPETKYHGLNPQRGKC